MWSLHLNAGMAAIFCVYPRYKTDDIVVSLGAGAAPPWCECRVGGGVGGGRIRGSRALRLPPRAPHIIRANNEALLPIYCVHSTHDA